MLPIDVLPLHDRVNLRVNYLKSVISGIEDPISNPLKEILSDHKDNFTLHEVEVPTYLTPFPEETDLPLITMESYENFLKSGGLERIAETVRELVEDSSAIPFLLSIEHALTYGAIKGLIARGKKPSILVFDAHLDTVSPDISGEFLHSGNFLAKLYKEYPDLQITIVGVQDDPELHMEIYETIPWEVRKEYPEWKERFRIYDIDTFKEREREILSEIVAHSSDDIYISIDADVCAGPQLWGVRFFEGKGIIPSHFPEILGATLDEMKKHGKNLVGVDFTEWDPLLMSIPLRGGKKDQVAEVFRGVVGEMEKF